MAEGLKVNSREVVTEEGSFDQEACKVMSTVDSPSLVLIVNLGGVS